MLEMTSSAIKRDKGSLEVNRDVPDVFFTIRPEPEPDSSEHVSN